jgi:hypothetical protein
VVFDLNSHKKGADSLDLWDRDEVNAAVTLRGCSGELDVIPHPIDALCDHVLESLPPSALR